MSEAGQASTPDVDAIVARLRGRIGLRSRPVSLEVEKGA